MKKVIISVVGCVLVVLLVLVCVFFFRGGMNTTSKDDQRAEEEFEKNLSVVAQKGEPDAISKEFAEKIGVDAKNVVSVGHSVASTKYSFTVDSWNAGKEYPGYEAPEGIDITEFPGAELDNEGNIINDYSYVVVNVSVKNQVDKKVEKDLVWATFRLKFIMPPSEYSDYIGEIDYLGEDVPRKYGHDYFAEDFEPGETKEIAMIFVVHDELFNSKGMYLEINPTGAVIDNADYDIRRYITLN